MAKKVTFILSSEVVGAATSGLLLGEFNNWDYNEGIKLEKQKDGSLKASASLDAGKRYEYRYLLNDGRWVNDQSADHYVHISGLKVDNCVIHVPEEKVENGKAAVTEKVPAATKVATSKNGSTKAATAKTNISKEKIAPSKIEAEKEIAPKIKTVKAKAPAAKK